MINLSVQAHEVLIDSSNLTVWQRVRVLFRLLKNVLPLWDKLLLRFMCTQCSAWMDVYAVMLIARLLDQAVATGDGLVVTKIAFTALAVHGVSRLLWFIGGASQNVIVPDSIMGYYMHAKIALRLKMAFYRQMQKLSLRFYHTRPVGEHMFRCTGDVDDASLLASEAIPQFVSTLQRIVAASFVLNLFGTWIFLPVAIFLVLYFCIKHWLATRVRNWDRRFRVENQKMEAALREVLVSDKLVRGYNRQRTAKRWYGGQAGRTVKMLFRKELFFYYDISLNGIIMHIFLPFLGLFTGARVLLGELSIGEYAAIGGIVWQLVGPVQELINLFQMIRQRLVPAERMVETLDVPIEIADPEHAKELLEPQGRIEFKDVQFSYDGGPPALDGVNIVANPGEKIAIVGPIGAGKTTLTNLILRLYDPQQGEVLIDNVNVRDLTQDSIRRNMGVVMQNIDMFSETLAKNILYASPRASREDMLAAAKLAAVEEFAVNLPQGYDTELSEEGSISGGQKQRVAVARALLRNPRILIMDEGTSALDPVTEKSVVEAVDEAFRGRTRIIVAHNLTNARSADRIYVLDRGRVVESGTHEELDRRGGLYTKLWTVDGNGGAA